MGGEGGVCVFHDECREMVKDHENRIKEVEKDLAVGLDNIQTMCSAISGLTEKIEKLIDSQEKRADGIEKNCSVASVTRDEIGKSLDELKGQVKWWNRAVIMGGIGFIIWFLKFVFEQIVPKLVGG